MSAHPPILPISEQEMTPLVRALIAKNEELVTKNEEYAEMILALSEQIQILKDEIAVLKGQKPRPKIPPNQLGKDKPDPSGNGKDGEGKRSGSAKRNKTATLEVNETRQIQPENFRLELSSRDGLTMSSRSSLSARRSFCFNWPVSLTPTAKR